MRNAPVATASLPDSTLTSNSYRSSLTYLDGWNDGSKRVLIDKRGTNDDQWSKDPLDNPFRSHWEVYGLTVLELRGVSKNYGAITALSDVDFAVESGEVVGLMGDNGAGKSTMVKIIAGNFPPSAGEIVLDGESVQFHRPVEARKKGVEIVYQDLALCDNLTAAANVFLGREIRRKMGPFKYLDFPAMYRRAEELFNELKSETRPRDLVKQMSGGQRQAVAIARTRLSDPKIVLMDEPTAAISVRQVAEVLDLITRLKETNHAVVLISHRMPDVFAVCDRVAVLRRGRKVADKPIAASSPEEVTALITGALETA